jgi:PAS domain S-box-containing protein
MDSLADGVFTVDRDWTVTFFNRAASAITGVPAPEALGRKCWDVFHSSICDGDCALKTCMDGNLNLSNKSIHIVGKDGKKIPLSISASPLRDKNGKIVGGVETFRDLSAITLMSKQLQATYTVEDIVSRSQTLTKVLKILPLVAASKSTVLLLGESGTGKELFARAIHNLSARAAMPYVAVNCAALPETLMESELFGYKKGAFTDAKADHHGRFQAAHKGTIFLDEIGDLPLALQVKLLRVLQEKTFEPLGSTKSLHADVRVIAATNRDLEQMVAAGGFRQDLYYRLNVVRLILPPLRERQEDIPVLASHFVNRLNLLEGKNISGLSEDVMYVLLKHDYPGNVRELQNILEYAFILCPKGFIQIEHLPEYLHPKALGAAYSRPGLTMRAIKRQVALDALKRHGGKKMAACRELDITKDTLRHLLSDKD